MSDSAKRRPGRPPNPIPSETVRARCPQPLARAVREAADRRGLTTSDAVREALRAWLEAQRTQDE
jgi:Arc/MetJ-type ribon-helix-helix transcriptional regulator